MRYSPELHLMFADDRRRRIELHAAMLSDMAKIPCLLIVMICVGVVLMAIGGK